MSKKVYKTVRKYQCPYCDKKLPRTSLIDHVQNNHEELIPQDYTAARVVYDSINKTDHGTCMICKKPVYIWNEKVSRYDNICSEKCRKEVRRIALERHIKTYNTATLLDNPEHQEKMLANRKISGTYKHSDGGTFTYTGKYEKNAIEFMDKVMNIPSKDIQMPGPTFEYEYDGKMHTYISDIYYIPANLIIEVKDGGNNPNNRNMPEYRGKQLAKEKMITELGTFNYLRLTNNNFSQLLEALAEIKFENMDQKVANKVAYFINEQSVMSEMIPGGMPSARKAFNPSTWIEPCMMDNTFTGYAIGNDNSNSVFTYTIDGERSKSVDLNEYISLYKPIGDTLVYTGNDSLNKFMNSFQDTFVEALNILVGYKVRTIDELCLLPNWHIHNKLDEETKLTFISNGIIREGEEAIGTIKLIDVTDNAPVKGSVFITRSNNGYYIHTPKDYYLASDFYESPDDIPQNIIDIMNDLYEQNKRRVENGE